MNKLKMLIIAVVIITLNSCACCYYNPTPLPYVDRCGVRHQRPNYYHQYNYYRPYYYRPCWRY
jgi:hypothetical protein